MPGVRPYPVALDLRGRACLIVGGGAVARRKAADLLRCGAHVTVVAPKIDGAISAWPADGLILLKREFDPSDVPGKALIFACTDCPEVNARVGELARAAGSLFNRSDQAADCDFAGMSAIDRGGLLVAISTGSDSPAFARWLREQIENHVGPEYGDLLELASTLRPEVKRAVSPENRSRAWQRAFESDALALVRSGDRAGALESLRRALFAHDPSPSPAGSVDDCPLLPDSG